MHIASSVNSSLITCYHGTMRTTIDLPEALLKNAKRRAARRGVTLSAVVADGLRYLLASKSSSSTPPFQLHTVRGRLLRPDLDLDRTSKLMLRDDEEQFAKRRT
jgi:hypothetical protein